MLVNTHQFANTLQTPRPDTSHPHTQSSHGYVQLPQSQGVRVTRNPLSWPCGFSTTHTHHCKLCVWQRNKGAWTLAVPRLLHTVQASSHPCDSRCEVPRHTQGWSSRVAPRRAAHELQYSTPGCSSRRVWDQQDHFLHHQTRPYWFLPRANPTKTFSCTFSTSLAESSSVKKASWYPFGYCSIRLVVVL